MDLRKSQIRVFLRRLVGLTSPPHIPQDGLRVLVYHRVRPDADDLRSVTPERFREHLTTLKESWKVVSLDDVLASFEPKALGYSGDHLPEDGRASLPKRAVLITFDDGFADLYNYALPLLQEFGFPAVVFMLARYVGRVGRTYSEANYPEAPFLSASQLREMQQAGIEIGSHGLWHVPLSHLPKNEAEREVRESKRILSDILGSEVRAFSYPWGRAGDFSDEHVSMVEKAGYKVAFTMIHGVNAPPFQRFRMRRCHVYPWDDRKLFSAILEGRFDRWCLKNSAIWNKRKKLLAELKKFLTRDGSGKRS